MPKLPPPPRTAQNRSGSAASLTVTSRPSAVTRSTSTRLSIVRPCLRASQPMPPPRVRPPRPTEPVSPNGVANPCCPAAEVYSPAVAPPWAEPMPGPGRCRSRAGRPGRSASVGRRVAGDAVAAALDRDLEAELACRSSRRARRRPRSPAARSRRAAGQEVRVVGAARRVVARVAVDQDATADRRAQRAQVGSGRRGLEGRDRRDGRVAWRGRRGRRRGPASRSSPWTIGRFRSIGGSVT